MTKFGLVSCTVNVLQISPLRSRLQGAESLVNYICHLDPRRDLAVREGLASCTVSVLQISPLRSRWQSSGLASMKKQANYRSHHCVRDDKAQNFGKLYLSSRPKERSGCVGGLANVNKLRTRDLTTAFEMTKFGLASCTVSVLQISPLRSRLQGAESLANYICHLDPRRDLAVWED